MEKKQPRILVMCDYYLPGYKGGGALRSIANMVEKLGDEFCFKIITLAHDLGEVKPYSNIKLDDWQPVGKAEVFYVSSKTCSWRSIRDLIVTTEYEALYLNSFFSPVFTIKPLFLRKLVLITKKPVILAPRGELSLNALKIKSFKKKSFMTLAKAIGLYQHLIWQASSMYEAKDIRRRAGNKAQVIVAPDIPAATHNVEEKPVKFQKVPGTLKVIFLSRIVSIKNLTGALLMLKDLKGEVEFNIYGPIQDKLYWEKCQRIINTLPYNIKARYKGFIPHDQVFKTFMGHDLFFLPSYGENFGNVIIEALVAGCPVLISDQTPWMDLQNAGWAFPLEQAEYFKQQLQHCIDMDNQSFRKLSEHAWELGKKYYTDENIIALNCELFRRAIL